ncbi:hypothetical protein DIC66_19395 [Rhodoferax lacus]|uniref:Uncharacterized protein n=1 Tax=Rhodoferax lacus TaxID=2184758 RepID=A0A3E1R7D9_9BURK|nr:hypothetical protein DIC66_19395 [Rhodoferax lacus]
MKGRGYLEGDLVESKWSQANACVKSITRIFEKTYKLKKDSVKLKQRYTEMEGKKILATVSINVPSTTNIDCDDARQIIREYANLTTPNRDLFESVGQKAVILTDEVMVQIKKHALKFLKSHGGSEIRQAMQINVSGEDVALIKGTWDEHPDMKDRADQTKEIIARYNGREFDEGLLKVKEGQKNPKKHEIYYDILKFSQDLKDLKENERAQLKLECRIVHMGKKTRLVLNKMTRLADDEEFVLTQDEEDEM